MPRSSHYGKPGSTVTGAERQRIISMITDGLPRNEIAKRVDRSGSTISGIAKAEGLEFAQRSKVKAATEARAVDLAARRQRIIDRAYTRMETLQDRLEHGPFKTILKGAYGSENSAELDFVPTNDERNLADTISRYVVSTDRLAALDADRGIADAQSVLTRLGQHLGVHE